MAARDLNHTPPLIVRAWFDTVLNPLVRALDTEAKVLSEGNLTWRFERAQFASLVPVKEHLAPNAWDNLEQFVSVSPDSGRLMDKHDDMLDELLAQALNYHATLVS